MSRRGKFIVFEGIDGSGKSSQSKALIEYLESRNIKCVLTVEPQNDRPVGALIRKVLGKEIALDEKTIALLFAADRLDHIKLINEYLDTGINVICDRYYFSSFAYNDTSLNKEWIISVNSEAMDMLRPDLLIFLDVPADASLKRVDKRNGKKDIYENIERQERVRKNYLELFERFTEEKVIILDGFRDFEEISEDIRKNVLALLEE